MRACLFITYRLQMACFHCVTSINTTVASVIGIKRPLFRCYQPVFSQLFKPHNMCQKRCMLSPSPSFLTALYILDPLSALCFLPQYASRLGVFFSPSKPRRDCGALIQATLSKAFGFLKYALDTNKVLRAMPPLIRSNCPASFIPRFLW